MSQLKVAPRTNQRKWWKMVETALARPGPEKDDVEWVETQSLINLIVRQHNPRVLA